MLFEKRRQGIYIRPAHKSADARAFFFTLCQGFSYNSFFFFGVIQYIRIAEPGVIAQGVVVPDAQMVDAVLSADLRYLGY